MMGLLAGCNKPEAPTKEHRYLLRITTSSWSGWEPDYQPEETTYDYELNGPGVIMAPPEDGFQIKILEMDANGVTFETETPMSPYGNTLNLNTDQTVFTVYRGQTLSIVTPTTDYGDVCIIEYVDASTK